MTKKSSASNGFPSRSDRLTVAVGFNPRKDVSCFAMSRQRRLNPSELNARTFQASLTRRRNHCATFPWVETHGYRQPVATRRKSATAILFFFLFACFPAFAQDHEHEYAPLHEKPFEFKDFTYKTLEGQSLNLRKLAAGKKLVLIHFFSAWCHNSNYDVATVKALYEQFKDAGLAVIGICEYSKPAEVREYLNKHQPTYPIVIESQKEKDRRKSSHFAYRTAAQDIRLWGTPFNVLLSVDEFSASGDIVTSKALVAFGELEKANVEKFLKERLQPVSPK